MKSEFTPNKGEGKESLPLFALSTSVYLYRVSYRSSKNAHTITYNSIHELILNLSSFKSNDKVTTVIRDDGSDFITMAVDRLRVSLSRTVVEGSPAELERLYLRLLITNQHGSVSDRGRYLFYDYTLRTYIKTIRGGIDGYLSVENRRVILRMKCRRLSAVYLYSTIVEWNQQNSDLHTVFVNAPDDMPNKDLLVEALIPHLKRSQIRMYSYHPIPDADNDRILPTSISSELIQIFNQLLK